MPALARDVVFLSKLILVAPLLALVSALLAYPLKRLGGSFTIGTRLLGRITRLFSGFSLICSILVALGPIDKFPLTFTSDVYLFTLDFYLDALSIYFVLLVNLVAFFASWYTIEFLQYDVEHGHHHDDPESFHIFFNAFHFTMLVVPMVDNLVILWMAIELTTLASTLLVRYRRLDSTVEAAWKYIIITTAGIVFALFGTIFMADAITDPTCSSIATLLNRAGKTCAELQDVDLMRWSLLGSKQVAPYLDQKLVVLSFLFVLVGYGTKAGFAPMHTWLPDGHGEAPSPVSALLSGVLLKSALYAILRFYTITNLKLNDRAILTSNILLFFGLLSLVLATPFILKRNRFKRILAYHSLEHMGIIAFGIGIGGPVALFGALLHALNHALTKALMFLTFGNVRREYARQVRGNAEPGVEEEKISGVLKTMPFSGTVLAFGGLGLVGSPPFNIFFSEFIILWAAFDRIVSKSDDRLPVSIYIVAVVLFLITVTLIFGGLVGHLSRLLLGQPSPQFTGVHDRLGELAPLLVLLVIVVLFGFWIPTTPVNFPELLNQSVCILQNGAGQVCNR